MKTYVRFALATVALAMPAIVSAQRNDQTSETKWSDQLAAGHWTNISNLNGAITVGQSTSGKVEVTATKHWRRGNPDDVKVVTKKDGDDIVICALWGKQQDCDDEYSHNSSSSRHRRGWDDYDNNDNDVSVDFAVLIPKGTKLRTGSVNGSQTITGATSEVVANTVNGELRVESSGGPLRANGVNGRVFVRMTGAPVTEPLDVATVNGSVILELPENLGADVSMTTVNGSMDSDWPLTVRGRIDPRNLSVHIGAAGGPKITLSTVNGSVELRKR